MKNERFNGELKRYFDQPFDQTSHLRQFLYTKSLLAVKTTMNSLTEKNIGRKQF